MISADRDFCRVPLVAEQERQDRNLFFLYGFELIGIETEGFDDGGSDLLIDHRRFYRVLLHARERNEQGCVRVILIQATVFGNL